MKSKSWPAETGPAVYSDREVVFMKKVNEMVTRSYGRYPEKILQFGEGNFLRAFVDWMIDGLNEKGEYEGSIVLCQPIAGNEKIKRSINGQDGDYTVIMRGIENGEPREKTHIVTSVSRCINAVDDYAELEALFRSPDLEVIVSNTTEAGISYHEGDLLTDRPAQSFPAKIAQLLYERYRAFDGKGHGLLFLPVELIDDNGYELKRLVLRYASEWNLPEAFIRWVDEENKFTSTLVDRIVTGYPGAQIAGLWDKLGYQDDIIDTCELFDLWVIEGRPEWASILPLTKGIGNVIWTDDVKPYKMRKVRILNGGHTSTVLAAYLAGHDLVLDLMKDEVFRKYLSKLLYEEVIPTIPLPVSELKDFVHAVEERFENPYIEHKLLDISLNSCAKFKTRCLPSLLSYYEIKKELPVCLTFALAAFIRFYKGDMREGEMQGVRQDGSSYPIRDDKEVLAFIESAWKEGSERAAEKILSNASFWDMDLTQIPGLAARVSDYLKRMETERIEEIICGLTE